MLSENLITQTEQIYQILESGHLSNQLCQFVLQKMRITDHEQYAYIDWLLTRWSSIRSHKYDLPKKTINLSNEIINNDKYCISCGTFSIINYCGNCGLQSPI